MRTSLLREASVLAVLSVQACTLPSGAQDPPSGSHEDSIGTERSAFTSAHQVGIFNGGNWLVDASRNHAFDLSDRGGSFGVQGDLPFIYHRPSALYGLAGIFRNGLWCFDWNDSLWWDGGDTCSHSFGQAGDRPVVGRWFSQCLPNECIGVFRYGNWYLDTGDKSWQTGFDVLVSYGPWNALPVTGSWRKTHFTNIGYFLDGNWVLDTNGNMVEEASDLHGSFGVPGDLPIAADWDGDGIDNVGIFRPSSSTFCLDINGNANWETGIDICFPYGTQTGSLPVVMGYASVPPAVPGPAIVACRYSDLTRGDDADLQLIRDEFTVAGHGKWGLYDYLKTVTRGKMNLDTSFVSTVHGWYTMSQTLAQATGQDKAVRAQWCRDAAVAGGFTFVTGNRHTLLLTDDQHDSNVGADSVINWTNWRVHQSVTYIAHEVLHQSGLGHSWSAAGGEYGDRIDIMSTAIFGGAWPIFTGPYFGGNGPSLNAAFRLKYFDPAGDDPSLLWENMLTLGPGGLYRLATVDLVALDHPEVAGKLMVRLLNNPPNSDFYTVEFREKSGLDRAISNSVVAVRRWNNALAGTQVLADLTVGQTWSQPNPYFRVSVGSIDTVKHVARVSLLY